MASTALKKISAGLIVVLGVAAITLYWFKAMRPYESTDNAYLKAHMSLISPKQTGYVTQVGFTDNQKVQPGAVLVTIDDQDFKARVAEAEAKLLMETAHIQTLQAQKLTQNAKIHEETANIAAADADLTRAAKDVKRYGNLAQEGAVSEQSRDGAESTYNQAFAQRDKFNSAAQGAKSQLAALDAQIEESRAQIKVAEAALELARIDLANTRIVAPLAGIIGNRSVQVGQLIKPGSALGFLIPEEGLFVEANFKETQIAQMQPGQAVDIHIDAYPDEVFEGRVDSFAPASGSEFSLLPSENATGNFTKIVRRVPVKILFKPGSDVSRLRPGLSSAIKVRVR